MKQLTTAAEDSSSSRTGITGPYYDLTLMRWCESLERQWPALGAKCGDRCFRMMKFYFLSFVPASSGRERRSCGELS